MNKRAKKNNQKDNLNFIYFPNKLNVITMFLIFIIYGLLLFGFVVLVFPKYDYVVPLNYEANTYNTEINPYVFIRGTSRLEKDDDNKDVIKTSHQMFVYIRSMNEANIERATYAYSALDNGGIMRYFIESSRTGSKLPISHNSSKNIVPKNDKLDKLFVKVKYQLKTDEGLVEKELKFSEEFLDLTKRDFNNFQLGNTIEDLVTIKYEFKDKKSNKDQFETNIELILADKKKPHHINLQSWLITEDGGIYPYLGLYNYSHTENFKPPYVSYVNKNINPTWIYTKLVYTDPLTNKVSELLYRVRVSDIKQVID